MKLFFATVFSLLGAVFLAGAIGYGPTQSRWGDAGVRSMTAIGVICVIAALIGALPMAVVARRWPVHIGQAALAGTGIRLLVTAGLGLAYQTMAKPHLTSFLFWAVVFYMLLLVIETTFAVIGVRRFYVPGTPASGGMRMDSRAKEAAA
ncbi:MAG TPA: hypothetical protein VJZ71_14255 [Phycisphaerae bacterium]|nr:hypothetical protein [Phycisphaerae bacterium]